MTLHPELATLRKELDARKDIRLFALNPDAPAGTAPVTGVQIRRTKETHVQAPNSYSPHTYIGWLYYGQAFAVDRVGRKALSAAQIAWRDNFEATGGLYLLVDDIYEDRPQGLGDEPEDIDKTLARPSNRVPLRLTER